MKLREASSRSKPGILKLLSTGVVLGTLAPVSVVFLFVAIQHRSHNLAVWLGYLSGGFIGGSTLCLLLALNRFLQARTARSVATAPLTEVTVDNEYVAQYPWSDRVIALAITGCFGALAIFFLVGSVSLPAIVFCALASCWAGYQAVNLTITRVRFTREGFVARGSWFRTLSEPYTNVQEISTKLGTLKIKFSDGRSVKIHAGLGNPNTISAYLNAHCPGSIQVE